MDENINERADAVERDKQQEIENVDTNHVDDSQQEAARNIMNVEHGEVEGKAQKNTPASKPGQAGHGPQKTRSTEKFDQSRHGNDGVIDVHFDGSSWCIEDESLEKPLQFSHLADAEARASELSKDTGRGVCVHDQGGGVIDSF